MTSKAIKPGAAKAPSSASAPQNAADELLGGNAQAPEHVIEHRKTPPAFPVLAGPNSQAQAQRIYAIATAVQKGNKTSYAQAADLIGHVSVKNLTPILAGYKAEMIDYLRGMSL